MNRMIYTITIIAIFAAGAFSVPSNVLTTEKFAWGENVGWLNWRDANAHLDGVYVGGSFLRGWIWGENIGWINVGGGLGPYANTNGANFGVNIDQVNGNLHGFAYAENVGWINFDGGALAAPPNNARYDPAAKRFRGYAWAENVGWINLDQALSPQFAATGPIKDCDSDGDVDGVDFSVFASCFNKAGNPPRTVGCVPFAAAKFDNDGDGDVDGVDFSVFASCFNKAGNPPRTPCLVP
jgi:hypothetical protein